MNPSAAAITQETLDAVRSSLSDPSALVDMVGAPLRKDATTTGITTGLGLVGVNLEAPSKKLFPVLSPLRNRIPRRAAAVGSTAVQWKAITKINAGRLKPGVSEGERNAFLQTQEIDRSQTYKTIGLDDFTNFEAIQASRGYEDVRAMSVANTLSALMVEEEKMLLGGNVADIGRPAAVTFVDDVPAANGTLTPATAYDVAVSSLTLFGFMNGATGRAGGVDAPDESDGRTGDKTTAASAGGSTAIHAKWAAVRGAVAYNVYVGTDGGTLYYYGTVTSPEATITALVGAGNVPNVADQTGDALSFDGIIQQLAVSGSGAYFKDFAGATITADNAGGIVEWDAALKALYDTNRIGPTVIWVSTSEALKAVQVIATSGSTTVLRMTQQVGADGGISGGVQLSDYLNKYTQERIPVMTHPYLPAGTTLMLSERLPYPNNNVPDVFVVDVRQEYTQYEWALVKRRYEYGVYASECLKVYFPGGCAILTGQG